VCGLTACGSAQGQHVNESLCFVNCGEFLGHLNDYKLLSTVLHGVTLITR
jgi:hypothetical protein